MSKSAADCIDLRVVYYINILCRRAVDRKFSIKYYTIVVYKSYAKPIRTYTQYVKQSSTVAKCVYRSPVIRF